MDFTVDLEGKIENTMLPTTKPLLPVFEAIVNSIQAIEDLEISNGEIVVEIIRKTYELSFDDNESFSPITGFKISDNGVGFNDNNYRSFLTSDSTYKKSRGSKGNGRFTWLKAFDSVKVTSCYFEQKAIYNRYFEIKVSKSEYSHRCEISESGLDKNNKTTVQLLDCRSPYSKNLPQKIETIGRRILEHCLPYFLLSSVPIIKIIDNNDTLIINDYFQDCTQDSLKTFVFHINEEEFVLKSLRFYKGDSSQHCVSYCAHSREVISENIGNKYVLDLIPDKKIKDLEGNLFTYIAYITASYFDNKVDSSRTRFNIEEKPLPVLSQLGDISMLEIREKVSCLIREDLQPILEKVTQKKVDRIRNFINSEAPSYRPLMKYQPDKIFDIPPDLSDQKLEIELHKIMSDYEISLKEESNRILENPIGYFEKYPEYIQKYHQFLEQYNDLGKSKLANYVVHRKVILEIFEKKLQKDNNGKYSLEEDIHEIIFPMRTTSNDISFEKQNLWIIDERLTFHEMLASDKKLNQLDNSNVESDDRPDILIFNNPMAFVEGNDQPYSSVVIIEFKRPMRHNYTESENPFAQIYNYIRRIKSGKFTDKNGILVTLQENTPFYVYIICDLTAKITQYAEDNGFERTPDLQGFFNFNRNYSAYIELISFPKLLSDAKKRNKVLFKRLNI